MEKKLVEKRLVAAVFVLILSIGLSIGLSLGQVAQDGHLHAHETPVHSGCCWFLSHSAVNGVSCIRNGKDQKPGLDYTWTGNVIRASAWLDSDVITCAYQYLPGK